MSTTGQQPVTLRSRTTSTGGRDPATGRWESSAVLNTDVEIQATVNPIPGKELATLPEGERMSHQIRVITDAVDDVTTYSESDQTLADHILWRGDVYEVRDVQIYTRIIPHLEIRARRLA